MPKLIEKERKVSVQKRSGEYARTMKGLGAAVLKDAKLSDEERINATRTILETLGRGLSVREDSTFASLVRPSDTAEPIQRWFRYREGYTVELCRKLFAPGESFVLDPFCGFGSTLVAAQRAGIPSAGLDVSPLAVFVSRVKTRRYSKTVVTKIRAQIEVVLKTSAKGKKSPYPEIRILDQLFHPEILDALCVFRYAIDQIEDMCVREFLSLGWISILEEVSNVYREGNGIKYRNRVRRGNLYTTTPYDVWQAKRFPADKFKYVREELSKQLRMMVEETSFLRAGPQPSVLHEDASQAKKSVPAEGASLILFSPPYCNCFNYIKAYKLELWMAGFIQNYPDIRRLTAMGLRSRLESLLDPVKDPYPPIIDKLVDLMDVPELWSQQLPDVVRGYFADMQRTLSALKDCLRPDGRCIIVVGNSAYGGVLVPSDLILAHIARQLGFEVAEIVVARHLTTSSQQRAALLPLKEYLRESIIHLRKPS